MAIVVTNAEEEKRTLGTVDRVNYARVFAVRGNRGNTPKNRYEKHRGIFQWSSARGAVSQRGVGPVQYSRRVDGTYSDRTVCRTPTDAGHRQAVGEEAMSGPKDGDGRHAPRRPHGIQYLVAGWWDILVVVVLEGILLQMRNMAVGVI